MKNIVIIFVVLFAFCLFSLYCTAKETVKQTKQSSIDTSNNGPSALSVVEKGMLLFQKNNEDSTPRTRRNDDFQFQYKDPLNKFPLPQWLDEFLNSQPSETHNETLADPNEKFIVMTCHRYKGDTFYEACGGFTDRLFLLPYYIWVANKTGRRLLM